MPAYKYEALDAAGRTQTGLLEAETPRAARAQLRERALTPLSVNPVAASAAKAGFSFQPRAFDSASLAVWTRQLAGLVGSGLPLERALTALTDEAESPRQRDLLASLRAEVNAGASFARAMATAPREFDEVYRGVVAAGEASGALGVVLERLADDLEERQALRNKVMGAMAYPAFICIVAVLIVGFSVSYVVPQVAQAFTSTRQQLPALTVAIVGLSAFVRQWGWLVALGLVGAGVALAWALRDPGFRLRFDAGWLRLPLIGRLARGYNAARFAATLGMLAAAGVPILKALQAAAETLSNHAMRADALDALVQVSEGAPLGAALAAKKRFPGLLAMFARLGEQTGQLPAMLERAGKQLSSEVQRRAMAAATILEPLLIVAMGLVVLAIVMAVLQPIIQLQNFAR